MADQDHFKQFNDKYGHLAGDKLLTQVGHLLLNHIRGSDIACRYGGEEFALFLPESSPENTYRRAEELREEISKMEVYYQRESLPKITISMGISTYPEDGEKPEELIQSADLALYRAKQEGRNQVFIHVNR
jgi:diguanylate cyclase (GGDEF)-like protein